MSDDNKFSFRPRARIMRTLGNELISNDQVAVIELVKNSFDADATKVLIKFIEPLEVSKGAIEIIDNGSGMSLDILKKAWMEPATPTKKLATKSKKLQRRVLGEKGIGRFASMRLSKELELFSKIENSQLQVYGFFDWSQFDDPEKYLDEVKIFSEERAVDTKGLLEALSNLNWGDDSLNLKENEASGTYLKLHKLSHLWGEEELSNLFRGLSRLISPFFDDKKFRIKLDTPDKYSQFNDFVSSPPIVQHPHYKINGTIDNRGKCDLKISLEVNGQETEVKGGFLRTTSSKLQFVDETTFNKFLEDENKDLQKLSKSGPLEVELRVWDRDELGNLIQISKSSLNEVRKDLDALAGISIYRDGFRVLPYGEPFNDWLRLDIRRVQKSSRLSNNQIVGYISVSADNNPDLSDQSNREGLNENLAYSDLKDIMLCILNELEIRRTEYRKPKEGNKSDTPQTRTESLFSNLDFAGIKTAIAEKYPQDYQINSLIDNVEKAFNTKLDSIKTVISRYHSLATLGQLIDILLHDGRQPLSTINTQSLLGKEKVEKIGISNHHIFEDLHKKFTTIYSQGQVLSTVFRRVEPFGGRKKGRPSQIYLEKVIKDVFEIFEQQLKESNISILLPESLTLVKVDPSEFQEVLINLIQNSIYWLQFVDKNVREIGVTVTRESSESLVIVFADSGPGILQENRERIFEPYFSTKPDGIGLGLAIAGEIISSYYDGSFELMQSKDFNGAVFKITLRKRV